MSNRAAALSTLLAVAVAVVLPSAAHANFPGHNGQIVFGVHKHDKAGFLSLAPGALYTVLPEGSGAAALPDDPDYNDFEPAWSPDGTRLAYASVYGGEDDGIYVATPSSGEPKLVANSRQPDTPAWSPDGSRIIYADGAKGLVAVPADGASAPKVVLRRMRGWMLKAPAYAADGKTVVFVREKLARTLSKFRTEIWAMDPSGANQRRIVSHSAAVKYPHLPDVSPDSTKIVFEADAPGSKASLFIANIDGSAPRALATAKRSMFLSMACWSPDGTKVVVSRHSGIDKVTKGSALVVIDVATGAMTTVRKASKSLLVNPSWQPVPVQPTGG